MPVRNSSSATPTGRILLVAATANGRTARKSVLEEQGHRITTANSGEEALERFAEAAFDVVVTEYKMPRMDGLELIERLRKHRANVPVVLIAGYADSLGLSEASSGADVVLQKSNNEVTHLTRAVARLLRRPTKKNPSPEAGAPKSRRKSAGV